MPRKREIQPGEAMLWLGVLLDAVFDPTSRVMNLSAVAESLNKGKKGRFSARIGRSELLSLASDFTDYPDDYPPSRQAEMLLLWSERWVPAADWQRLQNRVRKRRQSLEKA